MCLGLLLMAGNAGAQALVSLKAYEAFRASNSAKVPDVDEANPGLLVTPNIDGGTSDPFEARLVFKAIPAGSMGWTRHILFSVPGKLEFRSADESQPAWVPNAAEIQIPGPIDTHFIWDVAMYHPENWGDTTSVDVDYVLRDRNGRDIGMDRVRLLSPVIMAIGDSTTFGFQRESGGNHRTPPAAGHGGWSSGANWSAYPDDGHWTLLPPPWNVVAHKLDPAYQGFRGVLGASLPGFPWKGEDTLGHGPPHMGYNGAHISRIAVRAPASIVSTGPCYAILVYFAGLNDDVGGDSAAVMYNHWRTGLQDLLNKRQGHGKTLVIGVTLPRMSSSYGGYTSDKQGQLTSFNRQIRSYSIAAPDVEYQFADAENVPHDGGDDGLHFFSRGYGTMGQLIASAIQHGLR